MTEVPNDDDKLNAMINSGGDIAGGAVGAAIGFLLGGPAGAAVGGASGPAAAAAIRKIGHEATGRLLGPREKVRVGGALAIAAAHIEQRTKRGERLRTDGFFENRHHGRSDAEEVAENVLLRSQREAEERKIPFMAYLIGNIAFNSEISAQLAHQIVKAADAMTYRQLCIMKLAAVSDNYALRETDYRGQGRFDKAQYQILYECLDLYQRALINFGGEVAFGPTDVKPKSMKLQAMGTDMFNEMGLATIPDADVAPIAAHLSR
ncbi:hypothetical protein [Roseovarius sp. THAF9]|uniref:hypothetical protein n=1 Tax=Roseovarius sp. THAF9 TaxID=2587847 RepID=UPI0012684CCB|nr:hypothetical protein [Roseovarius sp. THAF9]